MPDKRHFIVIAITVSLWAYQVPVISSSTSTRQKRSNCNLQLIGDVGIIETPNYPNSYPPNAECIWRIRSEGNSRTKLKFEAFEIDGDSPCHKDYLEVRDGYLPNSNLVSKLCGNDTPSAIESTGGGMTLVFRSDDSVEKKGFRAEFESVFDCGGEITAEEGDVISPNHANQPGTPKDCVWVIRVPDNAKVALQFRSLQLEDSAGCSSEFVELRDGSSVTAPYINRFCGSVLPGEIRSSGASMTVKFVSNGSQGRGRFSAHFTKVNPNPPPPPTSRPRPPPPPTSPPRPPPPPQRQPIGSGNVPMSSVVSTIVCLVFLSFVYVKF